MKKKKKSHEKKPFYKVVKVLLKSVKEVLFIALILFFVAYVVLLFDKSKGVDVKIMPNGSFSFSLMVEENKDSF